MPSHPVFSGAGGPHLSVSLAYLRDILLYLQANRVRMYRLHSRLLPVLGERLREQIAECQGQLQTVRDLIISSGVRLSFHPYSSVILSALNEDQAARSIALLEAHAAFLDALSLGPEAVIVLHVGGVYDDPISSRERFIQRYEALPDAVRRRVVLEQDDRRFGFADVQAIHVRSGVPLVFDTLHHDVLNPERISPREALAYCLGTWPVGVRPKVHFSSPRTELRPMGANGRIKMPSWTEHADCVNPFEFIRFMEMARGLGAFDVMLEAKARDLALFKLRQDLARYAPALAEEVW